MFFTMRWRSPSFTLFPYTTLFRSGSGQTLLGSLRRHRRDHGDAGGAGCDGGERGRGSSGGGGRDEAPRTSDPGLRTDRKSTRLNSSHVSISYAVFCLKKKSDTTSQ